MIATQAPVPRLSAQQARNLHLEAQGLLRRPPARPRPADLLAAIERMQLLQIDTIHVVARSPYLVLFSRLGNYPAAWLDAALERGEIFECWSHEACFVPASRFALHRAHHACGGRHRHWADKHAARAHDAQRDGMEAVLAYIRENGPARTSDFEGTKRARSGWWGWKDEKRWLEALFARGELMVARRERFQRVYDLSERVIARMGQAPSTPPPVPAEIARTLIVDAVRALGITQARWIADYYRTGRKHKDADLDALVAAGELIRVDVRGWEYPGYVHADRADLLERARAGRLRATHSTLLSPFDPVVWDRARASAMFGFDYKIECYTPEAKRQYGYFVLPVLCRGRLVGRLDAKAHRSEGRFEIKAIHLQPGVEPEESLVADLADAIQRCADWHATPRVVVRRSDPRALAAVLRQALRS
ncbi:MAG TPA: crosslink repair DNA glycosylase YcaQ family protein [Dokdonella sp.]|nr:crosslink repair DNA glycosylase YcaQ family protein [Dokdonella sp.]